ncbi:hypothetical protein ABOZ73_05235 [Caulobacter sp. 73W]|uniref:Uncharacterized protein n=1 Tax=Caulobacter sp. 73W TaxID=3161137 RepID=A0AB39KWN3_9CAUL
MEYLDVVIAAIAATGGLGLAAVGLVDALKALPFTGIGTMGFGHVKTATARFGATLAAAVGPDWLTVIRAHWVNGRPVGEQKAMIRSLLRLGLTSGTAEELAAIGNVDAAALSAVAAKIAAGKELTAADITLLGRVEAVVQARLDAAFDMADQAYRSRARLVAGVFAVALAAISWPILNSVWSLPALIADKNFWVAVLAGLFAVPIAPVAKDLISALSAGAKATKAVRSL